MGLHHECALPPSLSQERGYDMVASSWVFATASENFEMEKLLPRQSNGHTEVHPLIWAIPSQSTWAVLRCATSTTHEQLVSWCHTPVSPCNPFGTKNGSTRTQSCPPPGAKAYFSQRSMNMRLFGFSHGGGCDHVKRSSKVLHIDRFDRVLVAA